MRVLVSGSMAYDYLLKFEGNFSDQISAKQLDNLSVAFLTPSLNKQLGGCAGNICYSLNQLGIQSAPIATIGNDFEPYQKWLSQQKISSQYLLEVKDSYTAQAFIISDQFNHQITAFHPGAMAVAEKSVLTGNKNKAVLAIIAPNGLIAMINQAKAFKDNKTPFIFDPGQGLAMFNKTQLETIINQADWLIVNQFESQMLCQKMAKKEEEVAEKLKAMIVTDAEKGSRVYFNNQKIEVKAVKVVEAIDPTGCGDAYRAGLIYGILNQLSWQKTLEMANAIGAIKVQSKGTQNHKLSFEKIEKLYLDTYNNEDK